MLVANFADLHARGKDLAAFTAQWRAALAVCAERRVDLIAIAGDVFDKHNVGDGHACTSSIEKAVIAPLVATGIKTVIIPGNHDYLVAGRETVLASLDDRPGIVIAREPGWVECVVKGEGISIFCLSWLWSSDRSPEAIIADRKPSMFPKTLLLAHVQIIGARMSGTRTCEAGSWTLARAALESFGFDRVAAGDFHARQPNLAGEGRGGYVGALRQLNHGESGNPAGFELWNTETNAVEWIELDAAPRYRTVEMTEAGAIPTAEPGEILRVQTLGWAPTPAEARALELGSGGALSIEAVLEREERIARGGEIPAGSLSPQAKLKVYGTDKGWSEERFAELGGELEEVLADSVRL